MPLGGHRPVPVGSGRKKSGANAYPHICRLDYQMRAKARILGAKARFNHKRRRSPFNPCRSKFQLHFELPLTPCWLYLTSVTHRWVLKPESFPILCFFELGRWSAPLIKWSCRFEKYSHAFQRLFFTEFAIDFYQMFTKCGAHVRCILATFLSEMLSLWVQFGLHF